MNVLVIEGAYFELNLKTCTGSNYYASASTLGTFFLIFEDLEKMFSLV